MKYLETLEFNSCNFHLNCRSKLLKTNLYTVDIEQSKYGSLQHRS